MTKNTALIKGRLLIIQSKKTKGERRSREGKKKKKSLAVAVGTFQKKVPQRPGDENDPDYKS